jgi:hypothetical protein
VEWSYKIGKLIITNYYLKVNYTVNRLLSFFSLSQICSKLFGVTKESFILDFEIPIEAVHFKLLDCALLILLKTWQVFLLHESSLGSQENCETK